MIECFKCNFKLQCDFDYKECPLNFSNNYKVGNAKNTQVSKLEELNNKLTISLRELLNEFNTITPMYEGGSISRVRDLAEKALSKSEEI